MGSRACGLVIRAGKLLVQRKRDETIWALPGGKLERGETPEAALVREFAEELGWTPVILETLWVFENQFTHEGKDLAQTEYYFLVAADCLPGEILSLEESLEFCWVSHGELMALNFRPFEMRAAVEKLLTAGREYNP